MKLVHNWTYSLRVGLSIDCWRLTNFYAASNEWDADIATDDPVAWMSHCLSIVCHALCPGKRLNASRSCLGGRGLRNIVLARGGLVGKCLPIAYIYIYIYVYVFFHFQGIFSSYCAASVWCRLIIYTISRQYRYSNIGLWCDSNMSDRVVNDRLLLCLFSQTGRSKPLCKCSMLRY